MSAGRRSDWLTRFRPLPTMGRIFVELHSVVHFVTTASTWFVGTRAETACSDESHLGAGCR